MTAAHLCKSTVGVVTLILLLTATPSAPAVEPAEPPRILFNCDGCSCSISNFPPPITLEQLCRPVNELANTQVDVFIHCVNLGGDAYNYPSRVGELFGQSVTDWSGVHPRLKVQADNLKSLVDAGHDPVAVLEKRTHELGMQFCLSMRMNEQHEDDVNRFGAKITPFKKQNRHLLIGAGFPPNTMAYAGKYGYTYSWNYAEEGTREHLLAVLEEMLQRYSVDGLELDFGRGSCYFQHGKEADGMPLMTEFVRCVRAKVDRSARARQHGITLAARVPPSFQRCRRLGLDVRTWITEGLVDLVIPMDPGYLDMQPSLREFLDAAPGTQVIVGGGLEQNTWGYGKSIAQMFAGASALRQQGARTLYLFNFDCHRQQRRGNPYTADEIRFLKTAADVQRVAREDKHYFVTRDMRNRTAEKGGSEQLPAAIPPGEKRDFEFVVGDDLHGAREGGQLRSVRLTITFDPSDLPPDTVRMDFNGKSLDAEHRQIHGTTWTFDNPPARQGRNTLTIRAGEQASTVDSPLRVQKIGLLIDYH